MWLLPTTKETRSSHLEGGKKNLKSEWKGAIPNLCQLTSSTGDGGTHPKALKVRSRLASRGCSIVVWRCQAIIERRASSIHHTAEGETFFTKHKTKKCVL
ncbi:hypothetical protein CDAR_116301 [Caerostris darwini]|uniref:Uncharacterized protein n=1 Tax=Caerostris darwini TaxID=1538125 RepID=A0AAV4WKF2_9ARAC|nr:hypothetical protein CDAR_116301 [Caerostris darwini]